MESDYGMTAYVRNVNSVKVKSVMKRLYSDFIVQEIAEDKTVARLLTVAEVTEENLKTADVTPANDTVDDSAVVPDVLNEDFVKECDDVFAGNRRFSTINVAEIDKAARTGIHGFLRQRYHGRLESETTGEMIKVVRGNPNRKRTRWPPGQPRFVHFTLAKENKETTYALGIIGKFLRVSTENFKICGLKDRRAVTAQRISVFQVEKERLRALNSHLRDLLMYDFEYNDKALKTGGNWGNRFRIALRSIPESAKDTLEARLKIFAEKGFINYFGTQRFGSCETKTEHVGRLILQRKWKEAVEAVLGSTQALTSVQAAVDVFRTTGDAAKAAAELKGAQAFASIEGNLLRSLSKGSSWKDAIFRLPLNIRSIYIHAYQSLLWNKCATLRWSTHGDSVVAGDSDAAGAPLGEGATCYSIQLPLPGAHCKERSGYAVEFYEKILKEDEISFDSFKALESNFSLGEAARPLMQQAENVEWKFVQYSVDRQQLQEDLRGISVSSSPEEKKEQWALLLQMDLRSGCYATVALREVTGNDMGKQAQKELEDDERAKETAEKTEKLLENGDGDEGVAESTDAV